MPVAPADQVQPSWQPYLSWDEDVKPWLQFSTLTGADATNDEKLRMVTQMACEWVQRFLGRAIAPTKFFRRFDTSSTRLVLPYSPILEIESVVETWGLNGDHVLVYQTPESQGGAGDQMYQVDWVHGVLIRTYQGLIGRPWFPGTNNIAVSWTAGYNPVPMDIRIATLELANYWWRNTQESQRTFKQMAEYDAPSNNGLWPGIPNRIISLLEAYVQIGIG